VSSFFRCSRWSFRRRASARLPASPCVPEHRHERRVELGVLLQELRSDPAQLSEALPQGRGGSATVAPDARLAGFWSTKPLTHPQARRGCCRYQRHALEVRRSNGCGNRVRCRVRGRLRAASRHAAPREVVSFPPALPAMTQGSAWQVRARAAVAHTCRVADRAVCARLDHAADRRGDFDDHTS
jgi:hypothetical protein